MNLIEQLGGYEETKKHLDSCWCDDDNRAYLLEKLLEYRRQNNIFEVGDKVVFLSNIAPEHDGIYTITEAFKNTCFIIEDSMDYRAFYDYIRHATPEEIKAGRRL